MSDKPSTICIACKHCLYEVRDIDAPNAWYNYFCKVNVDKYSHIDPVSGKAVTISYLNCRDINSGHCLQYESK